MSDERTKAMIAALLSDEGRTEAEMEAARRQAAKLMARHGFTEEDVLREDRDMKRADLEIGRHEWIVAKFIGAAVARLTGTQSWVQDLRASTGRRSDRKRYTFAGYRPDVEQAEWLMETVMTAAKGGSRVYKGDRAKSDFLAAFAVTVSRRISALCTELQEVRETQGSTALVVVKEANVRSYVEDLGVRLRDGRSGGRSIHDAAAASAGRAAGERVGLGRPIGSGPLALR